MDRTSAIWRKGEKPSFEAVSRIRYFNFQDEYPSKILLLFLEQWADLMKAFIFLD